MQSCRDRLLQRCNGFNLATEFAARRPLTTRVVPASQSVAIDDNRSKPFDINRINVYSSSPAASSAQVKSVEQFFTAQTPTLLFSQAQFRLLPASHHPEVTVLGRSNVGKSSLLNALFNRDGVALTSSKPGKTKLMNGFGISPYPLSAAPKNVTKGELIAESWRRIRQGMVLVDMPGYGSGSRSEWGPEIMKYLGQRRQLRRAFLLIDSEHGVKSTDLSILAHLYSHGIPHTVVLSKIDKILHPGPRLPSQISLEKSIHRVNEQIRDVRQQLKAEIWQGRDPATDFLCVSSEKSMDLPGQRRRRLGINELRWAMLCACGLEGSSKPSTTSLGDITILD